MFVGTLSESYRAVGFSPLVEQGLAWLRATDFSKVADGTYELEGRRLYAMVQSYNSRPESEGFFEAHRRYTDIQVLLAGRERFGYAPLATLKETDPYDPARDLHKLAGQGVFILLEGDRFVIAEPSDAHMPCIEAGGICPVRKVVLKVAVE